MDFAEYMIETIEYGMMLFCGGFCLSFGMVCSFILAGVIYDKLGTDHCTLGH